LTGRSRSPRESRGFASGGIRAIEFVCRQQTKEKGDKLISSVVSRVDYVYRHQKVRQWNHATQKTQSESRNGRRNEVTQNETGRHGNNAEESTRHWRYQ
jgi:hypothetical protein